MDSIVVQDEGIDIRINKSIAELDRFIQSQNNSLDILRDGINTIEELRKQATIQPMTVLETVMNNRKDGLKLSEACLELDTSLPQIDWNIVASDGTGQRAKESTDKRGSRVDRIRSHIVDLHQTLATLPALPTNLLDDDTRDAEEKAKKRRRTESTARASQAPSSSSLRLPYSTNHHDVTTTHPFTAPKPNTHSQKPRFRSISSPTNSAPHEGNLAPTPLDTISQLYMDYSYPERRPWASKGVSLGAPASAPSCSPTSPVMPRPEPVQTNQVNGSTPIPVEEPTLEPVDNEEQTPSTFKQNWTLAEQHMLERLLVEIPSTVKFRWVRISEAMGGTRTPRQVASRVQKYYEKMKKLGVAVNSADMGGGGRGGSKATQDLDMPSSTRGRGPSTRGKPKTGPQYTKSGRRR